MSVYDDVLEAICELADAAQTYSDIVIGSMPPDNGISIAWGASSLNEFMNKNAIVTMTAVLNGKHCDQKSVSAALGEVHRVLTRRKRYPEAENFQITNISTLGAPIYIGREANSQWLYGSSLRVRFFLRGD